jgi:hypothetical protein
MDVKDINRTISELEQDSTTFENCEKLAHLYIVRDNFYQYEAEDILPQYIKYVDIKRRYQLGEVSEKLVEKQIILVCKEVSEFLRQLYSSTDLPEEREVFKSMITGLQNI